MAQQQLPSLPPVDVLRARSAPAQTAVLDLLFEPSPAIYATLLPVVQAAADGASYPELIDACHARLRALAGPAGAPETLRSVVAAHPRLGETKLDSAQSAAEQASLAAEDGRLAALNREYEERFPGLRYVVFVNGRPRPDVMREMRARIDRADYALEVDAALQVAMRWRPPPLGRRHGC